LRPKIWLIEANAGWKTVEVSKNEVPDQKASIAVPPRESAMMGNATLREVASSAATKVMIHMVTNIIWNLHPGLKPPAATLSASISSFVFSLARSVEGSVGCMLFILLIDGVDEVSVLRAVSSPWAVAIFYNWRLV